MLNKNNFMLQTYWSFLTQTWRRCLLLAFVTGALLPLAFAPFHLIFLALICPMILAALCQQHTARETFWLALAFGLGLFGIGTSWVFVSIHQFSDTPLIIALLITALFVAALALVFTLPFFLYRRFFSQTSYKTLVLGFPLAWVVGEWLRSVVFTGFPWLFIGYTQVHTPLAGFAPIAGIYAISALVIFSSALLLSVVLYPALRRLSLISVVSVWGIGFAFTFITWTQPKTTDIQVSLLQGNIPQDLKWDPHTAFDIIERYTQMTLAANQSRLIVWPEASFPLALPRSQPILDTLADTALAKKQSVIIGIPMAANADGSRYYNAAIAIGDAAHGTYSKRHLVPFGEFMPFESLLRGMVGFFNLPMSYTVPGPEMPEVLHTNIGNIGVVICYEIAYSGLVLSAAQNADILLTISNDTWFGGSIGPDQHLQIAQMRALETGRYVMRATNNGITAIIDHKGNILTRLPQDEVATLTATVTTRDGKTPLMWLY